MRQEEEYTGHTIIVETYPLGKGYRWSYQIDNGDMRECRDRPLPNERVVLGEAMVAAKSEIDRKKSGAPLT